MIRGRRSEPSNAPARPPTPEGELPIHPCPTEKDPWFARSLGEGRPPRPREYRHARAWRWLLAAAAALAVGVAPPHGLLLAAGLVLAGLAAQLFDPHLHSPGHRTPRHRTPRR